MGAKAYLRRKMVDLLREAIRTERDAASPDLASFVASVKSWSRSMNATSEWMIRMAGEATDLAPNPVMKFVRNTWMPIREAHFAEVVAQDGSYQIEAYRRSLQHVASRRVALDVGANIGLWARQMCRDFETVHAFEPQSLARACLQRNVTANNCIVYPYACGAERGELSIVVNPLGCGGARLSDRKGSEPATIVPLDSLDLRHVDYVKIDVQGFELQVLEGARNLLNRDKPVVVVEVENSSGTADTDEISRVLDELGFRQADRVSKDAIFTANRPRR